MLIKNFKSYHHNLKFVFVGFLVIYLLRFLITKFMGLMPQDAYYYYYSDNLAMSYFDHPPAVAYMLKLTTLIFGKSVWVIKLTDFFVSVLSFLSFYYLCSLFLSKRKAIYASILYGTTFLLTIISINTTPDVPLILFWTLSLIAFYKAIFENKIAFWMLAGILTGLSFDSKYTGVFLVFGVFSFLIFSKKFRHLLFSKQLLLFLLFFLVSVAPVLIWNIENDWISLKFQSSDRIDSIAKFQPNFTQFFGNIGTQMLLLIPVLFGSIFYVFWKLGRESLIKKRAPLDRTLFLLAFSIPVIALFFSISLFYWVKLNWMMPGYLTAIILVSYYLNERKILGYQVTISLILHVLLFIQIVYYPAPIKSDDTWAGWEELSQKIKNITKDRKGDFIFSNDGYKTTAVLKFYLENQKIYGGNIINEKGFQFSLVDTDLSHLVGQDAIFIDSDKGLRSKPKSMLTVANLSPFFREINELDPIIIYSDRGKLIRKFWVFECKGYRNDDFAMK